MVFKASHRGDDGFTDLGSKRVSKDSIVIEFEGEVDELVSLIGVVKAFFKEYNITDLVTILDDIQRKLMHIASYVALMGKVDSPIDAQSLSEIEKLIDDFSNKVVIYPRFVVPGASIGSALLHFVRAVCRRVERRAVRMLREGLLDQKTYVYLNRLSDLLYLLALYVNVIINVKEDLL
ncbi:cob(I)yrinic acid a,c-diamide adenosyltransferase [Ignisphaera sp. 4213-co]|uniref:Cob(I)yrinic acid a,c-diamide adenosyltransferase n=1 Tax=Ignisphaera cupida TaxID=3050454 RepID=A0ABD4Z4Q7_9CREN|nr:cob(I)yrinic acid a,c-diamide adenosyltransferase [Ignisphaera sp. 4213-co]MDK6028291.1 cob(I)yrinic acid a,c-diamide adenosyltransferase [Ignisphaera sp. 4213-co]